MGASDEQRKAPRGEAPLSELLDGVLANLDLKSRFREHLAVIGWPQIVGRVVAAHARAEAVRDGVLLVATDTPAWAQELHMRRKDLLGQVVAHVGEGAIRDIHFRSGLRSRKEKRARSRLRPAELKLSGRQERQIKESAAQIEDPDLQARAERAFSSLARLAQWRKRTGWRRCARCGNWQRVGRRWCASCTHGQGRRRRKWGR